MRQHVAARAAPATVSSAGLLVPDQPCPPEIVALMAETGVDLSERRSRQLTPDLLEAADLVLTMERQHVREVGLMMASAWPRTFTLKEAVRRGTDFGWRSSVEPLEGWVARLHAERQPAELLGSSSTDDVADPYGGTVERYAATKLELERLVFELVDLIWPDEPARLGFTGEDTAAPAAGTAPPVQPGRRSRIRLIRRR